MIEIKNILSLFDGISCGYLAAHRAGILWENYYASEIDVMAMRCSNWNHGSNVTQIGDVREVNVKGLGNIDLLIGGSPCKGLSGANNWKDGLNHPESRLFWEYVRILEDIRKTNPNVYFLLENVQGHRESTDKITEVLDVKPISINSKFFSAQNRPRYYWTNIPNQEPVDRTKAKYLSDVWPIFGDEVSEGHYRFLKGPAGLRSIKKQYIRVHEAGNLNGKRAACLTALGYEKWNGNFITHPADGKIYHLNQRALEQLQTLPNNYTRCLSYKDAYKVIGNGWTVDVIAHILKGLTR